MIRRRLLIGTLSNGAGKLIASAAWFVLTPIMLAALGADAFALWSLVGAIAAYGMLLEHGFGGAIIKYVAEHIARGEQAAARAIVATAVWLYAGLAVVAVLLSVALAPVLPPLLNIAPADHDTATWLIALTGVNMACAIGFTPASAVLRGLHRYDLHNALFAFNSITEATLVAAVLLSGGGLLSMMAAFIVGNIVSGVASVALVARVAPHLRLGLRGANRDAFRRLGRFSTALFPIEAGRRLQSRADGFVIAAVQGLAGVTPFALARRLAEVCELAAIQFVRVVLPVASELHASNELARLRQLYLVSSRVSLAIAMPVAVVLMFTAPVVLTLWVGSEYTQYGPLVSLLAVATVLGASQWPAAEVLLGMGRPRVVAITACASGVANIALGALLLTWFGLTGVAVSAVATMAVGSLGVVIPAANRVLQVPARTLLREAWLPPGVASAAAACVLWIGSSGITATHVMLFAATVTASGVAYWATYLLMPAAASERRLLKDGWSTARALPRLSSIRATQ
jgi:O-antigen/teichoic acid export membrane protein